MEVNKHLKNIFVGYTQIFTQEYFLLQNFKLFIFNFMNSEVQKYYSSNSRGADDIIVRSQNMLLHNIEQLQVLKKIIR